MHFAGMNVPDELVQAHAEGKVVFLVGAGASMGAPTSLPSFSELTCRIAELVGVDPPTKVQLAQPDVYLGSIDVDEGVDVHGHVAHEITLGRRRNKMHDALSSLAAAPGVIRLVTTNFDNFLATALKAQGHKFTIHRAPSIPLGDDFEGIVHLHGHLLEPRRIIVTDADFGAAYITKGWASTFLRALFAEFTVCFVGYSHEDRMMDYFARGLSSAAQPRFIFTDRIDAVRWKTLGITPIIYDKGAHHILGKALATWGTLSSSTLFGRAQRVRAFQGGAPPSDPDDADFLTSALTDPSLVEEVCAVARGEGWAKWMTAQRSVKALVGDSAIAQLDGRCLGSLAQWAAREGTVPESWGVVYDFVRAGGSQVHTRLVEAIVRHLGDQGIGIKIHSGWLRWLLSTDLAGSVDGQPLLEILWSSDVMLSDHDTILLLEKIVDRWSAPGANLFGARQGSDILVEEWHLKDGIDRRMLGKDAGFRRATLVWGSFFFERAHRLVRTADSAFDDWNWARSAIDRQGDPGRHDAANVLIDLLRDVLNTHLAEEPAEARRLRSIWLNSVAPLLRRIALHNVRVDSSMDASAKLDLLLECGRLFDIDLHHEPRALLADIVPSLGPDAIESLVETIAARIPPHTDLSEYGRLASWAGDYEAFALLAVIHRGAPAAPKPAALSAIEARRPDWQTDGDPYLSPRADFGSRSLEDDWPWQPAEFHDMLKNSAAASFKKFARQPRVDERHGWWGAGNMLTRTIEQWPDDGLIMWSQTEDVQIRASVVEGWSKAELDEDHLQEIGGLLREADIAGMAHSVLRLLSPWSNNTELRGRWSAGPDGKALARRIFPHVATDERGIRGDLMSSGINTPVGRLAEYWTDVAIGEARAGVYPGGLLSEEVRSALGELLDRSTGRKFVEAILLRNLLFFFRADPTWARDRLLVLIDPACGSSDDQEQAWSVVMKGQYGEDLLEAGVRDWLITCSEHVAPQSVLSQDLPRWIASIAVTSTMADADRLNWLNRVVAAGDLALRVSWTEDLGRQFTTADVKSRLALWRRWIHKYIRRRVSGVPRVLDSSELTVLITLVAGLPAGTELTAGLNLLSKAPCGLAPATRVSRFPVSVQVVESDPNGWAAALAHLLRQTNKLGLAWTHDLVPILIVLKAHPESAHSADAIENELFRLGVKIPRPSD